MAQTVTVVTATAFEARAARRELPSTVRVVRAGVGLSRTRSFDGSVISCGLAGGTERYTPTGTVLIPETVVGPDGTHRACDASLTEALTIGARRLGLEPVTRPLFTSTRLVRGRERETYADRGFAGVDMETALIEAPRLAAVRIILDTPLHELSEAWLSPVRVLTSPRAWGELPWLMREGARCARLAARVIAAAFHAET